MLLTLLLVSLGLLLCIHVDHTPLVPLYGITQHIGRATDTLPAMRGRQHLQLVSSAGYNRNPSQSRANTNRRFR